MPRPHNVTASAARLALLAGLLLALAWVSGCGGDGGGGEPAVATGETRTATSVSYTFAVMGDSHTDGLDNGVLKRAVTSAAANGARFIIHTGDVTNIGAAAEFKRYREFADAAPVPFYSIPGNHDIVSSGDAALFSETVGAPYYSFDYGGDHFVLADYSDEENGLDPVQLDWLAADLAEHATAPRQFIFTHIPLLGLEVAPSTYLGAGAVASGQRLVDEALKHDNVAGFFAGHVHGFIGYRIGGVDAWISGGAGAEPYPSPLIGYYHYLLVKAGGAGVTVEVVKL